LAEAEDRWIMQRTPGGEGLYDARFEHDACGVGFVVDVSGRRSREIVSKGLRVLASLEHRGACGCESDTGDGAGLLVQTPHRFFARECEEIGIALPAAGAYAIGNVFLPQNADAREQCQAAFAQAAEASGHGVLGWRQVPTDASSLGPTARASQPVIRQVVLRRPADVAAPLEYERRLYVLRRCVERAVRGSAIEGRELFYIPSLSSRTIVYKGMLSTAQLPRFYPDVVDAEFESGLVMVHSRFSTNTFPSWSRAHPYRLISHNGEINTLRGNVTWMHAREALLRSDLFDVSQVRPVIDPDGSDSAMFDNVLELLYMGGRSLPHAMMMMIPEPWSGHEWMAPERRSFYRYHGCLMEPWDGPAAIGFTDGIRIGAVLDRNGLRPSRYYVTSDGLVVMASEVGVLELPIESVVEKGRLQPGRMFLVDTELGRIVSDDEIKREIGGARPYGEWLARGLVALGELPAAPEIRDPEHETVHQRQEAFGYTTEDLKLLVAPMATLGVEPVGAMGTDTPLAVLSERAQPLFNYFKQLFAQVTNPPVDAIREELVMGVDTTIGPEGNLLDGTPEQCRQIELRTPILLNDELERLRRLDGSESSRGFRAVTLPMLFELREGGPGLERAVDELAERTCQAVREGCEIVVLSDRGLNRETAAIPSLLAVAGVQHALIRAGLRTRVGLVLETGEPREIHHFSLLVGYGASAVNPYLVFETLRDMARRGLLPGISPEGAEKKYVSAANKGVVKVISKMGISTIQSYHGAQVFEAIGLDSDFVEKYFGGTPSRVGGIGIDVVAREVRLRHQRAFPDRPLEHGALDSGGQYQFRKEGEYHLFNPETVHRLQHACRTNDFALFQDFSRLVNDQSRNLCTLRGLMELRSERAPVPIGEVEPVVSILRRFKTGAMSYGSISQEAHEALAIAMNRIGGKSNTGEGGEDSSRYVQDPNGDNRSSAIKQVASGRFGVTSEYLVNARELQIKMAQGAKPGEGGQLPGHKVYPWIARVRHSTPGVGLISPPPHHDIYSIEDLAELIYDLKNANPSARVSVKLVSEVGVGTIAAGVAKAHADVVLISGYDGGTGASPLGSIKHAGVPWELGLAETQQVLLLNGLRDRITVETDGQLKTGRDVVIAALLGAEEYGFATAPLVALGCVMMRVCHLNTCPVGVATQDPELRKRFTGDPAHVINFMRFVAEEVRELMAELGFRSVEEMVGRTECLEMRRAVDHWKAHGLDFSRILHQPTMAAGTARHCTTAQDHGLARTLDATTLIPLCRPALENRTPVAATLPIRNVNRVVGTMLGSEVTRRFGAEGLPPDTIRLHFQGSAGQSFAAFVPKGVTLVLEGDANDYVGKGLSGGRVIVYPPRGSRFRAEENVIVGNVAFYGATSGEAFVAGIAGERFCVRNSGLHAVVEGVGDHGCEYMTGGRVVVLGRTGRNFAAGMSGGLAYVLDDEGDFARRCNREMVLLGVLDDAHEVEEVRDLVDRHCRETGSARARKLLGRWEKSVRSFVRILPKDFARVLDARSRVLAAGISPEEAEMAAFELNARDLARVGGR
jgi:glutamate synthase (NADPH/NADH) large chain